MSILKQLRLERNLLQKDVAQELSISQQAYANYENGLREPDNSMLVKLANYFNVSVDYLLGLEPEAVPKKTKSIKVYVYGKIKAGIPMEAIEDIIDVEEISEGMIKGGKEYFALKISGNSMNPNYIDGDVVIFEKTDNCENGDDCAVMVNGYDATFKRIEKKESGVMLKPLNPEYETTFFTNKEIEELPVKILGVAKELRRKNLK